MNELNTMPKVNICILLTATIDSKGVVFMERNDPSTRENDYIIAMKKWMKKDFGSIVFCENSGYNLDKIKKIMDDYPDKKTEILQFEGQDFPREYGKSYGELMNIKYAVDHSKVIKNSDYVLKVNGRYFIKNIKKIIDSLSHDKNIYIMAEFKRNLTVGDSRVFAFNPSFISDYLSKFQDSINDSKGFYFEHALARATLGAMSDGHKWVPLPHVPVMIGHSGTTGIKHGIIKDYWLAREIVNSLKNYLNKRI